jgi:hypothetical protein
MALTYLLNLSGKSTLIFSYPGSPELRRRLRHLLQLAGEITTKADETRIHKRVEPTSVIQQSATKLAAVTAALAPRRS